jgi:hypothetical protein
MSPVDDVIGGGRTKPQRSAYRTAAGEARLMPYANVPKHHVAEDG